MWAPWLGLGPGLALERRQLQRHQMAALQQVVQVGGGEQRLVVEAAHLGGCRQTAAKTCAEPNPRHRRQRPCTSCFSTSPASPATSSFAVGGIAVAADCWADLRARWEAALTRALDSRSTARRSGTASARAMCHRALADALFAAVAGAPVTCFVVVLRPLAGRKLNDGLVRHRRGHLRHRAHLHRRAVPALPGRPRQPRHHGGRQPPA